MDTPLAQPTAAPTSWGAVWALALGVAGLVSAELLPVSLLTPMARDLAISEGAAGQSVTAVAAFGFVTSLTIAVLAKGLDRRPLLLALALLQLLSSVIVALAPNLPILLAGRALLGVSLGGFWALSASLALRLVPEADVPRALSIIFGGVSVATVAAGPLGSLLGDWIGWRGAFWVSAGFSALTLVAQAAVLPSMPSLGAARMATLLKLLKRRSLLIGLAGVMLSFGGHFAFFTYLRPFIEQDVGLGGIGISIILGVFGVGVFVGTWASGALLARDLKVTMLTITALMAATAVVVILFGHTVLIAGPGVFVWGALFGFIPVGWSTWLTRAVPDQAESGGGLLVAAIQIAISSGAAVGGLMFDRSGAAGAFGLAALLMLAASIVIAFGLPKRASRTGEAA